MYEILRENLIKLRKNKGITQVELADILKYSDKTVSKWETGETLPTIETLVKISDFYGISVDDLLRKPVDTQEIEETEKVIKLNKNVILSLAITSVFLIATSIFVGSILTNGASASKAFISFIWAAPISAFIYFLFTVFWYRKYRALALSITTWALIAAIFINITVLGDNSNYWMLFLIGVPIQILIIFTHNLKYNSSKIKNNNESEEKEEKTT